MCHFGCAPGAVLPTVCVSHSWQWRIIKVDLTWNVGRSHPLPFLHPLVSERRTWQGVPSAGISSGSGVLSPPPQMHLGPAVVSSSPLFGASVQHQMTALIRLTQGLNKTTGVQRAGARWTWTYKHSDLTSCNHYMLFLCLFYSTYAWPDHEPVFNPNEVWKMSLTVINLLGLNSLSISACIDRIVISIRWLFFIIWMFIYPLVWIYFWSIYYQNYFFKFHKCLQCSFEMDLYH